MQLSDKHCLKCGAKVTRRNKSGYCNVCRDRTGTNNPFFGKKHNPDTINKAKEKLRKASKTLWENAEYRAKVIEGTSKPRKEFFKQEQSKRIKKWYAEHPEQRELRRANMSKSWANGSITSNGYSCNRSNVEKEFFSRLVAYCPWLNRNTIHGQRRWFFPDAADSQYGFVIEFYGNFWHANPELYKATDVVRGRTTAQEIWNNDLQREHELEDLGYRTIVVWENEYKTDPESVIDGIDKFLNWESCAA